MSRITRSRQVGTCKAETVGAKNARQTTAGVNSAKSKVQDKKPITSLLGSKLHSVGDNNRSSDTESVLKSPALRDRTNTTNEIANDKMNEVHTKKKNQVKSKMSSKTDTKRVVRKADQKTEPDVLSKLDSVRCVNVTVANNKKCSNKEIEDILNENQEMNICRAKLSDGKMSSKVTQIPVVKVDRLETAKQVMDNLKNSKKNSMLRKKNMSMEEVEGLLNDDDNEEAGEIETNTRDTDSELEDNQKNDPKIQSEGSDSHESQENLPNEEEAGKIQKNKKFFRYKQIKVKEGKSATTSKRPRRQAACKKAKMVDDDDSDLDVIMKVDKQPTEPSKKNLRCQATKNYCELSQIMQSSNLTTIKETENEKVVDKEAEGSHKNHLPIYKQELKLSQENIRDKEEIYEFPDNSQEKVEKVKKKKKVVKRPAVKRPKKVASTKLVAAEKKSKKLTHQVPRTVQFKENGIMKGNDLQPKGNINTVMSNRAVPKDIPNIEGVGEIPTIKIISCEKLDGSKRINLMTTPNIPKTINSELKLFGPTNAITSKPKSSFNNMMNHSLIRQSMSPIVKCNNNDDFDDGSPWRPIDAFSRVNRVVQSTPQIIRPPFNRGKKLPIPMPLKEKSICSMDTIHISSENPDGSVQVNKTNAPETKTSVSPRKFGTVISNTNPLQSQSHESIYDAKTVIDNSKKTSTVQGFSMQTTINDNQPSPAKITSPQSAFAEQPTCNELSAAVGKENTQESPSKQNNENDEIPVRFQQTKTFEKPTIEKRYPVKLKQTNLNAFLNRIEMPESTCISTPHGIFDDIPASPRKPKKLKEQNVEFNAKNAFGFDDDDDDTTDEILFVESAPHSKIVTEEDVKSSVKGKVFTNARVKSAMSVKASKKKANKKPLLKAVLKKNRKQEEMTTENSDDSSCSTSSDAVKETEKTKNNAANDNDLEPKQKELLNAVSFSDTFDIISENEDLKSKIPEEVPLFVDLEPVHFSKPPRRSYQKRKREVHKGENKESDDSDDGERKKLLKARKKKKDNLSKEDRKRMNQWVKSINETFEEIDHFDLVVE
ncbi:uncharacterized protein LOC106637533 isoform X2 [Copidosoma floridanum]|uniref:uncharacterized protein LOC106637533 isoform X2 n=1 Tax=Copidosoma floridanum TaxID=29053 RepID=UPI0006C93EB2|nr:uncharacterized protein LOC106637533 isoform X2 [Copidosoma floridanum]